MPTSRRVVLVARPDGIPQAEHFRIEGYEPPALKPGEILVRNQYLSVEPAMRGWVSAVANYAQPVGIGVGAVDHATSVDVEVGAEVGRTVAGDLPLVGTVGIHDEELQAVWPYQAEFQQSLVFGKFLTFRSAGAPHDPGAVGAVEGSHFTAA